MSLMLRRCCIVGAFCGIGFAVWVSATPSGYRLRQRFAGWVARGKTLVRLADDLLSASADSDGTLGHWRTLENRVTAVEQQWSRMREDWRIVLGADHTRITADRARESEIRETLNHTRQVALRVSDFCEQLDARVVTTFSGLGDLAGRVALLEARATD